VTVPLTENEFGAMVSLCFNIGARNFANSSVVKKLNVGDRKGAADAFLLWNEGTIGGKRQAIPHLTERRKAERALFLKTADKRGT
jgi:lysozyme